MASPILPARAALGSERQVFEGQKMRGPISETTAGTSVMPAASVVATAIARTLAAEEITLPTRVTALTIASRRSSPRRRRSR
jgi:acetylglutamate kinase